MADFLDDDGLARNAELQAIIAGPQPKVTATQRFGAVAAIHGWSSYGGVGAAGWKKCMGGADDGLLASAKRLIDIPDVRFSHSH